MCVSLFADYQTFKRTIFKNIFLVNIYAQRFNFQTLYVWRTTAQEHLSHNWPHCLTNWNQLSAVQQLCEFAKMSDFFHPNCPITFKLDLWEPWNVSRLNLIFCLQVGHSGNDLEYCHPPRMLFILLIPLYQVSEGGILKADVMCWLPQHVLLSSMLPKNRSFLICPPSTLT